MSNSFAKTEEGFFTAIKIIVYSAQRFEDKLFIAKSDQAEKRETT